jgi:hypothetical protein
VGAVKVNPPLVPGFSVVGAAVVDAVKVKLFGAVVFSPA